MLDLKHLLTDPKILALDTLSTPLWLVPQEELRIIWANKAAVGFWRANSLKDLVEEQHYKPGRTTLSRFEHTQEKLQQGLRTSEFWTLYPQGQPVSCKVTTSPFELSDGTQVAIVEAAPVDHNPYDHDMLRGVEALRYTSSMISVYSELGYLIMHNPAARDTFGDQKRLEQRFVESKHALKMMGALQQHGEYGAEVVAHTKDGERVHLLETSFARDPVTGQRIIVANAQDISERPNPFQLHTLYLNTIHDLISGADAQHVAHALMLMEGMYLMNQDVEDHPVALDEVLENTIERCQAMPTFTSEITLRAPNTHTFTISGQNELVSSALTQLLCRAQQLHDGPIIVELEKRKGTYRVHVIDQGPIVPSFWRDALGPKSLLQVLKDRPDTPDAQALMHVQLANFLINASHGWLDFITSNTQGTDFFFDLPGMIS